MPSANVNFPLPLNRLNPVFPGQFGVPGAWTETGLRQHCTGAVFYVDPNMPGVSDQRDGTDPTEPLRTVSAALARCQPYRGDVIAVMAANYWPIGADLTQGYTARVTENVTVSVPGVRIVGVFPSGAVGVPWVPATAGGTCVTVAAIDVLIEGFCFLDTAARNASAIHAVWTGGTEFGDNLTVRHCFFSGLLDYAVRLTFSYYAHIHDNRFDKIAVTAINDETASDSDYPIIYRNLFMNCGNAIKLPGVDQGHIHENWILGDETGADNYIDLTGGADNIVADNWLGCSLLQYQTTCTGGAGDAWINNHCTDGDEVAPPP
jgi:hypothetical protein